MKSNLEEFLDRCDRAPFERAMARVKACTYTDENGKEWIDGAKLFGKNRPIEINKLGDEK